MIWEKDRLQPTQPYFVFDTEDFYQEIYLRQGISHFYTFHVKEGTLFRLVPDGCIDLFFEDVDGRLNGFVYGTMLAYSEEQWKEEKTIFGVRFMPGMQPEFLNVTLKDLLGEKIPLTDVLKGDRSWLAELKAETEFYQRIRVFLEHFTKAEKRRLAPDGKKEIIQSVKKMVYASDGKVKVSEMCEQTGYSERYINKVFIGEMGFSPKTFCKIIQFQRALEFLNYGAPDKMTDAAVYLGYYDQSQFIRDFTKYAGVTPKQYLDMTLRKNYRGRIHTVTE